jgi:hypothetical protein
MMGQWFKRLCSVVTSKQTNIYLGGSMIKQSKKIQISHKCILYHAYENNKITSK